MTDLLQLVDGEMAGSPTTRRKWVRRSLRQGTSDLQQARHAVSHTTVEELLREYDYTLRANVKPSTRPPHPDRDRKFRYFEALNRYDKTLLGQIDSSRGRIAFRKADLEKRRDRLSFYKLEKQKEYGELVGEQAARQALPRIQGWTGLLPEVKLAG